jgi:hypothetical protein
MRNAFTQRADVAQLQAPLRRRWWFAPRSVLRRFVAKAGWLFSLSLLVPAGSGAQRTSVPTAFVTDAPSCPSCSIASQALHVLGTSDGPGSISPGIRVVRVDTHGRYWVVSGDEPPLVFDSTGRFVRLAGRSGRGPGEFIRPRDVVTLPGDSLLVIDGANRRAAILSSSFELGRTIALPYPFAPLVILKWPDAVVANGMIATTASSGWPLHQVSFADQTAAVIASFGPDSGAMTPGAFARIAQVLTPSASPGYWAADYLRYRLTHWTPTGAKTAALERRPDWFARPSELEIGRPDRAPDPAISSIAEDSDGLLWVFVRTPARSWREAWPKTGPKGEVDYRSLANEKLFKTMVEVIDPRTNRVVARQQFDSWIVSALPNRRAAIYTTDADGVPHVTIVQLRLNMR